MVKDTAFASLEQWVFYRVIARSSKGMECRATKQSPNAIFAEIM